VGEEHVCPARSKPAAGHLLDSEHDITGPDVFDEMGSGFEILFVRETAALERLYPDVDSLVPQVANVSWSEGRSALPGILVLAT
jgi:hypothetical protein